MTSDDRKTKIGGEIGTHRTFENVYVTSILSWLNARTYMNFDSKVADQNRRETNVNMILNPNVSLSENATVPGGQWTIECQHVTLK